MGIKLANIIDVNIWLYIIYTARYYVEPLYQYTSIIRCYALYKVYGFASITHRVSPHQFTISVKPKPIINIFWK